MKIKDVVKNLTLCSAAMCGGYYLAKCVCNNVAIRTNNYTDLNLSDYNYFEDFEDIKKIDPNTRVYHDITAVKIKTKNDKSIAI